MVCVELVKELKLWRENRWGVGRGDKEELAKKGKEERGLRCTFF